MTAAQKTAKAKFKQAIAYRQKTGVSLKEAFAHVYGKKVGAAPKKKAAKKAAPKKAAKKKHTKYGVVKKHVRRVAGVKKKVSEQSVLNKIHKVKDQVSQLDELQHKHMITGIDDKMFKDLYNTREKIAEIKKYILKLQAFKKVSPSQKNIFTNKINQQKKYLQELNVHYRELKKFI
jgi:anion-transporting  ArsA/GET3 family ATPase